MTKKREALVKEKKLIEKRVTNFFCVPFPCQLFTAIILLKPYCCNASSVDVAKKRTSRKRRRRKEYS